MRIMDAYLLLGLLANVAFLGLADWVTYRRLVTKGYDSSMLIMALLNVAIAIGIYYLIYRPLRQRYLVRKIARAEGRLPAHRSAH